MEKKTISCNNCGIKGHLYKDCRKPVISCGNIIYRTDRTSDGEILMIQRKDSLCYIEFLRGKYDIYNLDYIQTLIDKCSIEEKEKLSSPFDILWKQLWLLDDDDNSFIDSSDYRKGYDKFTKLSKGYLYMKNNKYIDLNFFITNSKTAYSESEWEFPKGRRNNNESDLECAQREFGEETNLSKDDYQLIENVNTFSEDFMGENRVRYRYIYYIGILTRLERPVFIDPNNKDQYTEIKDIRWFSKVDGLHIIRDYHHTRRDVIHKTFKLIDGLQSSTYSLI
jgi:8-oxo-dGTP pyrophosphatase MutT (NUDIX family)|tara:strand:- start:180 stop:1019 length:840 start_codon:yes stop_codon:yes gene_type:complete